ncbi:MAG: SUMF1/EgtB/PvdO family nonheme iron enzyme [Bacteroidales bacterium]|jgi:formylglycine-generating enzyme required for sulfatase activity|nr:SUMF1/EgtB/PvdO family nonheme iron enzyme [Bacteroidales bacterium]
MRRIFLLASLTLLVAGCGSSESGELIGVQNRKQFEDMQPYGMVEVPQGSFMMGSADEDPYSSNTFQPKTVQINSFWMDETEITNNEYRQFVYWVRDSIAYKLLGEIFPEKYLIEVDQYGEEYGTPLINWKAKIDWTLANSEERDALDPIFIPTEERFYNKRQVDTKKLNYEYFWIDYQAAAKKDHSGAELSQEYRGSAFAGRPNGLRNRNQLIKKEVINIYPDTLCWMHDYAYSYNDNYTRSYFSHPTYDDYPVVGVTYKQAKAFSMWRTFMMNNYLEGQDYARMEDFRLPTEAEWEYAAKGGSEGVPYPWGGPYVSNAKGCFIANYKPTRGNYDKDGGIETIVVGHYAPNDFGLYDMAGNVAEWCEDTFNESAYNVAHDLNQTMRYEATDQDSPQMKRKVIRGGSWKDQKHFIRTSTRAYEYQDSGKSYVGFRCVQSYLGRVRGDNPKTSSNVYKH